MRLAILLILVSSAAHGCASAPTPSSRPPVVVQVPSPSGTEEPPPPPVVALKVDDVALAHGSYPRVHHPDAAIDAKLEPLIRNITAGSLGDREGGCSAWGTTRLVSVWCSQTNTDQMDMHAPLDQGGGAPNPTGWSATFLIQGGQVRQASLQDVLAPGRTPSDFVSACRAALAEGSAEPDPCANPKLTFDLGPGGMRFCTDVWPCHVLDQDAVAPLLDPAVARELGWQ